MKSQRRRSGIGLPEVLVGLLGLLQVAGESCHVLRTRAAFLGVPVARRCSPSVGTRGTSVGPHVVLGPAKKAGAADGEAKKPATRKKSASAASGEAAAPKKATTSRKKAASTEPAAAAEPAAEAPKPRKRKTAASSPAAPAPVEARPPAPPVAAPVEALAPAPPATPNALYDTRLVGRGQALNTFAGDQTFNVIKGSEDVVAPWSVDGFEVELPDWRPQPSQRYEITDPDMDDKLAKVYHMFGAQVRLVSTYDGIFRFFYFGEVRNLIGAEAWTKIIITEDLGIKECKQVRFETSYVRDWPDDYN